MNSEMVFARSAIEALRAGVPSRHAVAQLGTTQQDIKEHFDDALLSLRAGEPAKPLVISANFGGGKSHLLNYLQTVAERQGFVTSFVVISPEMPLGAPHVVLKAIVENAQAPNRIGKALQTLAADASATSDAFALLREWTQTAPINGKLKALIRLYEEYRVDDELRVKILDDIEGDPLLLTTIKQKLKDIGEVSAYDLKAVPNQSLAHDRIRLYAQFVRACGSNGLVILFDEAERIAKFSRKQRILAYQELGWWRKAAEEAGSAILPVFAMNGNFIQNVRKDEPLFQSAALGYSQDERDQNALDGIEMLNSRQMRKELASVTPEDEEEIKYRVKTIYERAYGMNAPNLPISRDVSTTVRSQIRRWITYWDLRRYSPDYQVNVEADDVQFDTQEISDDALTTGDETDE